MTLVYPQGKKYGTCTGVGCSAFADAGYCFEAEFRVYIQTQGDVSAPGLICYLSMYKTVTRLLLK